MKRRRNFDGRQFKIAKNHQLEETCVPWGSGLPRPLTPQMNLWEQSKAQKNLQHSTLKMTNNWPPLRYVQRTLM